MSNAVLGNEATRFGELATFFAPVLRTLDMEELVRSLESAPVVDRGEYQYFVHPVTDGIPLVEPKILEEIAAAVLEKVNIEQVDKILTAEAMGIHLTTAVSLASSVPFVIARKRKYGFENEVAVHQETGYGENELYINNIEEGDRLLVLDDVISTGNTLAALAEAVEVCGASIEDIVVVIRRRSNESVPELPVSVTHLVELDVIDGEVVVFDS